MLEFNFSPFPVLQTERLLLRRIGNEDAEALFFLRSNDEVMRFLDKEKATSIDDVLSLIERIDTDVVNNNSITWAMTLKENPSHLVGHIGLWRIDKAHHRAEIGYTLHPDLWNKGLMSEAMKEVIRHGFEDMHLHSIEAHTNPANEVSGHILQKAGFVAEAYFKESHLFRGKFLDTKIFSLLTNIKEE